MQRYSLESRIHWKLWHVLVPCVCILYALCVFFTKVLHKEAQEKIREHFWRSEKNCSHRRDGITLFGRYTCRDQVNNQLIALQTRKAMRCMCAESANSLMGTLIETKSTFASYFRFSSPKYFGVYHKSIIWSQLLFKHENVLKSSGSGSNAKNSSIPRMFSVFWIRFWNYSCNKRSSEHN